VAAISHYRITAFGGPGLPVPAISYLQSATCCALSSFLDFAGLGLFDLASLLLRLLFFHYHHFVPRAASLPIEKCPFLFTQNAMDECGQYGVPLPPRRASPQSHQSFNSPPTLPSMPLIFCVLPVLRDLT
jgi:hypothetical protein